jgi:hypothetical protein
MKYKFSLLVILLTISTLSGINENAGTSGFSFLKIKYSTRAAAMGNAYTGLADDAGAVFFNPSGLVQIKNSEIQATYMNYIAGINCGSIVYVHPFSNKFVIAGFSQFLSASETRTLADASGNYIGNSGEFGISNLVIGFSVSRYIIDILNLGFNIKYIRESLDNNIGSGVAFDVSILHQTTNKDLKVGLTYSNIGTQLTYYTDSEFEEKLPQVITVGFNYHPLDKLYLLLDLNKPLDLDFSGRLGVEYKIHEQFCLRAGYKINSSDWKNRGDLESFSGLSFGLGILLRSYKIDYAIFSYGDLGFSNQISLGYSF